MNARMLEMIRRDCHEVTASSVSELTPLKGECVLITGGTGFMGTWLVELITYLNDYYDFCIKMILLSERAYSFSAKAPHLAARKDISLIARDISSVVEIPDDVTMIIHAAGTPDNRIHASEPLRVAQIITGGTSSVLAAASRLPQLKRFLNISSSLVYGPQPLELERISECFGGGPNCSSPSSTYAEAKRFAEILCSIYRNEYKMEIITARPFAFIGPYQLMDRPWAINNFIRDGLSGGPIRILGDSETLRSYMYPSDMAFWLLKILVHGVSGLCYNVGNPDGVTLRQVAEKVASNCPIQPQIISNVAIDPKLHRSKMVPDVNLAQKTLELKLFVDTDEAIRRTLLWNRENIGHM
jgi:dTDP-glucose 4,6-dehydratase